MSQRYDIVIIGHITDDLLVEGGRVSRFTGGAAWFSAFAAQRSGARVLVVTRMAQADRGPLERLRAEGIEVIALPSAATTSIENLFETADVDRRKVRLLAQADPFRLEDVPPVEAAVYSLAGLFLGEIPQEMIELLSRRGKVALDLQAMLRASRGGRFSWQDWPEKRRYLPFVSYLKADSLEAEVITGTPDRREAARLLHAWGAREVMITCSSEVILFDGTSLHAAPFNPANLSGRSGRGDTCFISYLSRRLAHGAAESLLYAAALTSIKMETFSPFTGRIEQVFERMKSLV